ncbi:MAG: STY4528 family pathogenicity island replication protein [Panacagrimonas sp.]
MNPPKPRPGMASPRTQALDVMIRVSLERLIETPTSAQAAGEALLFMGNWHDAMPRLLIQDAVLEPVDKIVWQVIKLQAQAQTATSFPSYAQIERYANVSSDATVSRALAILRATRWLTLCARARDQRGRFRGSIYALHDEPLPLADTLYLDQDYMQFLMHAAQAHSHDRARQVAQAVIESLQGEIEDGDDVLVVSPPQAQRLALQTVSSGQAMPGALSRGMAIGARWVASLHRAHAEPMNGRLQKSKAVESPAAFRLQEMKAAAPPSDFRATSDSELLQNLKTAPGSSSCSSSEITRTTTTTTTADASSTESVAMAVGGMLKTLRFPTRLNDNDRRIAAMHLRKTPENLRQVVLDLLDRKLKAEEQGGERVLFPTAYLAKLCQRAQANALVLESSLPTQSRTEQRAEGEHENHLKELTAQAQAAQGNIQHWTRMQKLYADSRPDDPFPGKSLRDAQERHAQIQTQIKALTERWTASSRSL